MTNTTRATFNTARSLEVELVNFYASTVGKTLNTNEEFSLLVEWRDAIDAALTAAINDRSWQDVDDLDAMSDHCNFWLDYWREAA